jgi:hypothetical protein
VTLRPYEERTTLAILNQQVETRKSHLTVET